MTSSIPRSEHPRPDFCRDSWITLNGPWDFSMGQDTFDQTIMVPFALKANSPALAIPAFIRLFGTAARSLFLRPCKIGASSCILAP